MLKQRIIPKFLISGSRLVKFVGFHGNLREAGNPVSTARVYDAYGADELMFLDIDATPSGRPVSGSVIERVSEQVFMPFTVGGGIRTLSQIESLLRSGADKVSINTAAIDDPSFVREAAARFGDQCIVVGIDYRIGPGGRRCVVSACGHRQTDMDPLEWALRVQDMHAGEVMLCSIDRDGGMFGYDLELLSQAASRLDIPVIASSGAGSLHDCAEALRCGVSAITVSSMFLFSDHSPIKLRTYLASNGFPVRSQQGGHS
jgi:cyclase